MSPLNPSTKLTPHPSRQRTRKELRLQIHRNIRQIPHQCRKRLLRHRPRDPQVQPRHADRAHKRRKRRPTGEDGDVRFRRRRRLLRQVHRHVRLSVLVLVLVLGRAATAAGSCRYASVPNPAMPTDCCARMLCFPPLGKQTDVIMQLFRRKRELCSQAWQADKKKKSLHFLYLSRVLSLL